VLRVVAGAKQAVATCFSQFDGSSSYKVKFEKVFLSMKELSDCKRILLDNEFRLQEVHDLAKMVESIESACKEMVKVFQDNTEPVTASDLMHLSETAKNIALVIDAYGMAATRQLTLEHNLILCINGLYDNAR
jgi:chaperonin GroEL (HSP60 family)